MSNAIKFTPRNGKIDILIEKINQTEGKNKLRVSVTDNGLGIKNRDKGKMFQIFGTIKDRKRGINTKGIGLGLVISKLIVEKFNG